MHAYVCARDDDEGEDATLQSHLLLPLQFHAFPKVLLAGRDLCPFAGVLFFYELRLLPAKAKFAKRTNSQFAFHYKPIVHSEARRRKKLDLMHMQSK